MLKKPLDSHDQVRTTLISGLPVMLACVILTAATSAFAQPPKGDDPTPYVRLNVPGHTAPVNAIAFSRDSQRLFTAGHDKAVRAWRFNADRVTYDPAGVFRWEVGHGSRGRIRSLGVSPGQAGYLAVAGFGNRGLQGEIVWLDPMDGSFFASYFPKSKDAPNFDDRQHNDTIWNVAFSPDGQLFASADINGNVLLWSGTQVQAVAPDQPDRRELVLLHQLRSPIKPAPGWCPIAFVGPNSLAFYAPAGKSNPGGNVWHVQRAHFDPANTNAAPQVQTLPHDYNAPIYALAGSEDGRYLAAASERELVMYDLQNANSPKPIQLVPPNSAGLIRSLALSPGGEFLAVGWKLTDGSGKVELWKTADGSRTGWQASASYPVAACAFNADPANMLLAYASGAGSDVSISVVNGDGNVQPLGEPLRGGDAVQTAGFEIGAKDRNQRIYFQTKADGDTPARWLVFDPERKGDDRLSHLPDGAADPKLYDATADPNRLGRDFELNVIHGKKISKACWVRDPKTPNGPKVAIAIATAPANLIFLYDVRGNAGPLRVFQGHESTITSLNISPDQRYLVSSAADGMVSLWSLDSFHRDRRAKSPADVARLKWGIELELDSTKIKFLDELGPLYIRGLRPGHVLDKMDWYDLKGKPLKATQRSQMLTAMQQARHMNQTRFHANTLAGPFRAQVVAGWFPMLSLYATRDEWIAWTPTGHYDSSSGGEGLAIFQFTQTLAVQPFFAAAREFANPYYQPELIQELFLGAKVPPPTATAQTAPTPREPVGPGDVPRIEIEVAELKNGISPKQDVTLKVRITPPFKEGKLQVAHTLDGMQYHDPQPVRVNNGAPIDLKIPVKLPDLLECQLGVIVNSTPSKLVDVQWKPAEPAPDEPLLYILAVGVAEYENGKARLTNAESDARDLLTVFQQKFAADYKRVIPITESGVLVGKDTTTGRIATELKNLMQQGTWNDTLVFYFAGHGVYDKDSGFCLVARDGESAELSGNGLLKEFCTTGPARKLLILDTCQSGGVWDDLKNDIMQLKRQKSRGRWPANLFAACQREQTAIGPALEGGIFTQCMVDGLRKEAYLDGPHIDVTQLQQYVKPRVRRRYAKIAEESQLVQRGDGDDDNNVNADQDPFVFEDKPDDPSIAKRYWASLPLTRRP